MTTSLKKKKLVIIQDPPEKPSYLDWLMEGDGTKKEKFTLIHIQDQCFLINFDGVVYNYSTPEKEYVGTYDKKTKQIVKK